MEVIQQPWYKSLGVMGALVGVLAGAAKLVFHVEVTPSQQTEIVDQIGNAVIVISSFVAMWGRIRATAPIAGTQAADAKVSEIKRAVMAPVGTPVVPVVK